MVLTNVKSVVYSSLQESTVQTKAVMYYLFL